jgi:hypothetical protein
MLMSFLRKEGRKEGRKRERARVVRGLFLTSGGFRRRREPRLLDSG